MRRVFLILGHLLVFLFLTVLTQIGGIVYLINLLLFRKQKRVLKVAGFIGLYIITCFLLTPILASFFGREKIQHTDHLKPVSYFTVICNRNYVVPEWNALLENKAQTFADKYPGRQIRYMDANFPFWDGFPLLPHLSHKDGKKLDVALMYEKEQVLTNQKPAWLGYGQYVNPLPGETDTNTRCKSSGYWQYDYTKYLGWKIHRNLSFSEKATADLVRIFLDTPTVKRIFIEPHLKVRLGLQSDRVRFHGCQAVRHDDHIHLELR